MNILLIKLPQDLSSVFHIMPPLGLGYLSSSVKSLGVHVEIIDCLQRNINHEDLIKIISQSNPNVIGFSCYTHDLYQIKLISAYIKKYIPKIKYIVVGGPHSSSAPEHTLQYLPDVDFAFKGEAEYGFRYLIECISKIKNYHVNIDCEELRNIPGLVYKNEDGVIKVNPQFFTDNLDALGFPDWELINPRDYFKSCHGVFYKNHRFTTIFTSRGCPQNCYFCTAHNIMGKRTRRRSAKHIIEEIKLLRDRFGIHEIHILDDNFTSEKEYILEFCQKLRESKLNIVWACPNGVRLDSLDEEMLSCMKNSGCYSVSLGIESGVQRVINLMNKDIEIEQVRKKLKLAKKHKLAATGFFIFGYPGEKKEDMLATIKLSKELPLDAADFSNFLPLPGSIIFKQLFGDDGLHSINLSAFSSPAHIINYSGNPQEDKIRKYIIRKAYFEFYLRPLILIRLLVRLRSIFQVYYILKRLVEYLCPKRIPARGKAYA